MMSWEDPTWALFESDSAEHPARPSTTSSNVMISGDVRAQASATKEEADTRYL